MTFTGTTAKGAGSPSGPGQRGLCAITASAPTRIDLAGGTIDIWPLSVLHPGCTVNMAINLIASTRLVRRRDPSVHVQSADQERSVLTRCGRWGDLDELPIVREVARHFWSAAAHGFDLEMHSQSPAGAGLGGSSSLTIALCAVFARARGIVLSTEERVEVAKNLEARVLGIPTGIQDYYAAVRGGLNVVQLGPSGTRAIRPRVSPQWLAERLVLIYSGTSRNSGINNWRVIRERIDGDAVTARALERIARASLMMADAVDAASWAGVIKAMRFDWEARQELAPGILTPSLRRAIHTAAPAASAWKVCGAGGGGCMLFVSRPGMRMSLRNRLAGAGFEILDFAPALRGLRTGVERRRR